MTDRSHNCRVPGCRTGVHLNSLAGVCRSHLHDPAFCGCRNCAADRARRDRAGDIRVVEIPYIGTASWGPVHVPISLPREPSA